ncbi:hypothetical protein THICB1_10125 [Thiomonas arsenitoxydans]|uniref:Uncharacterized protein n=1 Tax=Thiomonas arsenitoxydans (strain DSM 22701 / CIP 110005 / 3As) TaxID=426114 RepID=A0ABP1YWU3_THIA3|nr:hypothetical protein THICB1_10125 [Thiomonas arsenitoxydans]CQR28141.1 hypothetical protein THICB6_130099 [Thiomonas arsenitoxydans]CQR35067.1 hypothetical protein ACO7_440017 [Thiomonas arsenitoxydans]CQR35136.1 hypothetical protein ACO3_440017 [Thiomonas arsenitoxydans]CQR44267.1 hypothetical protein THICB3490114 [Thiomonas sp. CB3]
MVSHQRRRRLLSRIAQAAATARTEKTLVTRTAHSTPNPTELSAHVEHSLFMTCALWALLKEREDVSG